jgi:glucose/arabinose dehydrogenase
LINLQLLTKPYSQLTKTAISYRLKVNVAVTALLIITVACTKKPERVKVDAPPIASTEPSVETRPKIAADQVPVSALQTRVGAVHTATPLDVKIITNALSFPWSLAFLPDGRMLVTEKPGTMRIVTAAGVVGPAIKGLPSVKYRSNSGLMDVKLDPDFATSRLIFWTYVEPLTPTSFVTSIARGKLAADETKLEEVRVIYRAIPPYTGYLHPGSQLLFDKAGLLYACFGEHYDDIMRIKAQELNSAIGKIIRINKDGSAAAGNPFTATAGALPETWSMGHRDPQGLAFNPVTGDLWESEHGPMGGDEINLIRRGYNYGWPVIAYGYENSGPLMGTTVGNGTRQEGMKQPVYYWDPAIAPSGITFYTGTLVPEWKNNLFVASLIAKHISRLVIYNNQVLARKDTGSEGQRFRKVVQGPDGAIYAITDQAEGRIYRIGAK